MFRTRAVTSLRDHCPYYPEQTAKIFAAQSLRGNQMLCLLYADFCRWTGSSSQTTARRGQVAPRKHTTVLAAHYVNTQQPLLAAVSAAPSSGYQACKLAGVSSACSYEASFPKCAVTEAIEL